MPDQLFYLQAKDRTFQPQIYTKLPIGSCGGLRNQVVHTHTLAFNCSNHMGWNARKIAEALPSDAGLIALAIACSIRHWSTDGDVPGFSLYLSTNWKVRRLAGTVDLYADVVRRSTEILSDPTLSDEPLTLVYP